MEAYIERAIIKGEGLTSLANYTTRGTMTKVPATTIAKTDFEFSKDEFFMDDAADVIACLDGADILGYITVLKMEEGTVDINFLEVRADSRRQGIGRALLGEVVRQYQPKELHIVGVFDETLEFLKGLGVDYTE